MSFEGEDFIEQLLTDIMEGIKRDLRANDQYASGDTERLFEVKLLPTKNGIEGVLYGPSYLQALITGRGPTKSAGSSGGQTLQQKLFQWIKTKGIQPREDTMTQESLSWAIAKRMHEDGNKLFQDRGNTELLTNNITTARIDAAIGAFGDKQVEAIMADLTRKL